MEVLKYIFLALLICNVVAILAGIGRALLCVIRSIGAKKAGFTIFPVLGVLVLLAVIGVNAGLWFAYGVAHSGKKLSTDFLLAGVTCASVAACVFGLWKLAQYIERRIQKGTETR